MSEISAIELEAKLRQRAVELSIQSFGSYIHSTATKTIRKRARKFFDFLSGQDVNGVIPKSMSERIDALVKDFEAGNVTVEKAEAFIETQGKADDEFFRPVNTVEEAREDVTKNFVKRLRILESPYTYGGVLSEFNRKRGETVLAWFRRINPDGNNEYPVLPLSTLVELLAEVEADPDIEIEVHQNPGMRAPWVVGSLARVV